MTMTLNITPEMLTQRSNEIAETLRSRGLPVVGFDAPDLFEMVGLTFKLTNGRLCAFRLHYDDARPSAFTALYHQMELPDGHS